VWPVDLIKFVSESEKAEKVHVVACSQHILGLLEFKEISIRIAGAG
jgi:hypothetical protein